MSGGFGCAGRFSCFGGGGGGGGESGGFNGDVHIVVVVVVVVIEFSINISAFYRVLVKLATFWSRPTSRCKCKEKQNKQNQPLVFFFFIMTSFRTLLQVTMIDLSFVIIYWCQSLVSITSDHSSRRSTSQKSVQFNSSVATITQSSDINRDESYQCRREGLGRSGHPTGKRFWADPQERSVNSSNSNRQRFRPP